MFTHTHRAFVALTLAFALPACSSGEPEDGAGEEELITQVRLTLTPQDGGAAVTLTATDADGDGAGITFSPASLALRPGTTYDGTITVLDTINDEDITEEIKVEAEEHLFRYTLAPASAGTVTLTDTESDYTAMNANGGDFAVGLAFRVAVAPGASGTGTMNARLYHFDEGPKTSSTATSDETDIDVDVPVTFGALTRR